MLQEPVHQHHPPLSVVIAARNERVRAALWAVLDADPLVDPIAATADAEDLVELLSRVRPATVVVDDSLLAASDAGSFAGRIGTAFVVVGMRDHPGYAARARALGAADYVKLDEAERLGEALFAAATPFGSGRRRTGSRALTVVPAPSSVSTVRRPPTSSTRSRIPIRPKPSECADGSNP